MAKWRVICPNCGESINLDEQCLRMFLDVDYPYPRKEIRCYKCGARIKATMEVVNEAPMSME